MSHHPPEDDARLIARCRSGDRRAWETLVRRHQHLVLAIARRTGLDDEQSADVFQNVFLRLVKQIRQFSDTTALRAWLIAAAQREARRLVAQARRELTVDEAAGPVFGPGDAPASAGLSTPAPASHHAPDDPQESMAYWQRLAQVRWAVEQLDGRCRTLLQALFVAEPPTYGEVARRLGMPPGSVGPTRMRCLDKLRQILIDEEMQTEASLGDNSTREARPSWRQNP